MKRTAFTLIMLVMCSFAAFAQRNATITGTIVDAQMKDYLTGATVVVMGGTEGTIADANGSYRLTIPTTLALAGEKYGFKYHNVEQELAELRIEPEASRHLYGFRCTGEHNRDRQDSRGAVHIPA